MCVKNYKNGLLIKSEEWNENGNIIY
jgi:hypothetical protein